MTCSHCQRQTTVTFRPHPSRRLTLCESCYATQSMAEGDRLSPQVRRPLRPDEIRDLPAEAFR